MKWLWAVLLLASCGGGLNVPDGPMAPLPPLGWWGISPADVGNAPGSIAVIAYPDAIPSMAPRKVWFMVWAITGANGALTTPGWEARLDRAVSKYAGQVDCWYLFDEPGSWGVTTDQLAQVASHLPAGACVVLSLSPGDVTTGFVLPPQVTRVGVNYYADRNGSPGGVYGMLDMLASYGKEMYLSLDVTSDPDCSNVPASVQQDAIAINQEELRWAYQRTDVVAAVGFLWRSEPAVCGALDMPITLAWLKGLK